MNKKIIAIVNIVLPIILFILMEFFEINDYFIDIVTLTLVVGWLVPFLVNIISGITFLNNSHKKLTFYSNVLSLILCFIILSYLMMIFNRSFIYPIILYSILSVLHILNGIVYLGENRKEKDEELEKIKQAKKKNNGVIK